MRSSGTELKGLWEHLIETISARGSLAPDTGRLLEHYLRHGTLATRIGKAVGLLPTRAKLARVYEELCEALADGTPFAPPPPLRAQREEGKSDDTVDHGLGLCLAGVLAGMRPRGERGARRARRAAVRRRSVVAEAAAESLGHRLDGRRRPSIRATTSGSSTRARR